MKKLGKKSAKADVVSTDVNRNTKTHPGPKAEEVRDIYKRDWEFKKPHGMDSPYHGEGQHRYMQEYSIGPVPQFVGKQAHGFGHTGKAQVKGNLRCSGKADGHQIGKRKGK